MTNEVKFNEDDYVWSEDTSGYISEHDVIKTFTNKYGKFSTLIGKRKKSNKIEVGKVYTTKNGYEWLCITQQGFSYLVGIFDKQIMEGSTAHTWYESGESYSLNPDFNIDWSVEPVEMDITE